MRNIIKQILKEEINLRYQEKLDKIVDRLFNQVNSYIDSGKENDIDINYVENTYGLSFEMSKYIFYKLKDKLKLYTFDWIIEKISQLIPIEIDNRIVFVDQYNNRLLYYDKYSSKRIIYVNHEKLWSYLQNYRGLNYTEIQKIIYKTLKNNFDIPKLGYINIHTVVNNPFLSIKE